MQRSANADATFSSLGIGTARLLLAGQKSTNFHHFSRKHPARNPARINPSDFLLFLRRFCVFERNICVFLREQCVSLRECCICLRKNWIFLRKLCAFLREPRFLAGKLNYLVVNCVYSGKCTHQKAHTQRCQKHRSIRYHITFTSILISSTLLPLSRQP